MNSSTDLWFESWQDLLSNQPWQSTLEDWWRQFSQRSESPSPVFEKIAAQSHSLFQLAQELSRLDTGETGTADWQARLTRMFEELKQALDNQSANQARNLFWQMPLANWQTTVSSLPGFSGTPFTGGSGHPSFDPTAKLQEFLSAPGLGYTRESQEDIQKFSRLSVKYLEAQRKYSEFFIAMSKDSLDSMHLQLKTRMAEDGAPLTTVREFYDLWVDCSEEVYRARTMTDEYARLHGDMVNALMALKQHSAIMMDDATGMLNLPTRQELDTMHHRSQTERRNTKDLEREVQLLRQREADLTRQIYDLNRRIEELSLERSKVAGKKAADRKKGATNKAARRSAENKHGKKEVKKPTGRKGKR